MWILWTVLAWVILSMPISIFLARALRTVSAEYDEYDPPERVSARALPRDANLLINGQK